MKVTVVLEKEDFDALHDTIFDALGFSPTEEQIQKFWDLLPHYVQGEALQWGASDTVFLDRVCVWLEENKQKVLDSI